MVPVSPHSKKPIRIRQRILCVLVCIMAAGLCYAGENPSGNIIPYEEDFTLTVSGKYNIVSVGDRMAASYEADKPWALGLGLRYKSLSASFSIPLYKISGREPFSTFDFRMNSYPGKFYYSLFCMRYQDFYRDADTSDVRDTDMQLFSAGITGGWVMNHKNHSLGAVYNLSGRQEKSSGSPLLGFGVFYTSLHSRDGALEQYRDKDRLVSFGPSAGYSYTFVFPRNFFLNLMAAAEVNAGISVDRKTWHFMPQIMPRISFGYNHTSWSLNFVGDCRFLLILRNPERPDGLLTSSMTINFSYRF
ncbi:DUF4421 family protein [Breznakiella homolactica]|uniref:DUF4421 family protein n=1 Tax=Breznakiella homolactica TaxID=2798577 RepID=A0A7T7XLX8_9SPIR|nr:DUF4421 family protein [Breznakiella homolactica]QQO08740.1 DUF4421 domain-containing protein [Breznakiella homolactica]